MVPGKLYRLTEQAKLRTKRIQNLTRETDGEIYVYNDHDLYESNGNLVACRFSVPLSVLIVPLEVCNTTVSGVPLGGGILSRRLLVLLSSGMIGTLYVSLADWEEAV